MRYTKDHVWIKTEDQMLKIGISDYAQKEMGDIAFIDLPKVGQHIEKDDTVCSVDSLKATSDVYAPVAGTVTAINEELLKKGKASAVNEDPTGEGWLCILKPDDENQLNGLMTEEEYRKLINL